MNGASQEKINRSGVGDIINDKHADRVVLKLPSFIIKNIV
jgi:hypothetical protein